MPLPPGWLGQSGNFLGLEEPWCHPEQAGVYIIPAPYEHTSSYLTGSREGPAAILEASRQVELYDETLGRETYRDSKLIGRRLRVRRLPTSFFSLRFSPVDETQTAPG